MRVQEFITHDSGRHARNGFSHTLRVSWLCIRATYAGSEPARGALTAIKVPGRRASSCTRRGATFRGAVQGKQNAARTGILNYRLSCSVRVKIYSLTSTVEKRCMRLCPHYVTIRRRFLLAYVNSFHLLVTILGILFVENLFFCIRKKTCSHLRCRSQFMWIFWRLTCERKAARRTPNVAISRYFILPIHRLLYGPGSAGETKVINSTSTQQREVNELSRSSVEAKACQARFWWQTHLSTQGEHKVKVVSWLVLSLFIGWEQLRYL